MQANRRKLLDLVKKSLEKIAHLVARVALDLTTRDPAIRSSRMQPAFTVIGLYIRTGR